MAATIIRCQMELSARLEKAKVNFKKSPKTRIIKSYVETRITILEQLYTEYKNNHRELVQITTPDKYEDLSYFKNDEFDNFEESYTDYMSELKEKLEQFEDRRSPVIASSQRCDDVKLPRIQLPLFTGKYEEWQAFYDMFVSLIRNEKLSAVQKLHYLKSSISGEPENLLRNFPTTDQNYEEAWKQLTKRYNNKRYNTNAVLKMLFSQKPITNDSSHAIKQLLDTTTSCLKALNNMGIGTETWDVIIIYLVVSKMDSESHKQWENQISNASDDLPTWSQLVDFLESRFRSLELIDSGRQSAKVDSQPKKSIPNSFHASVQQDQKKNDISCALCGEAHYLNLCKQFGQQPLQKRRDFVQSKGLCFNCLHPSHVVNKCRQSTCCKKCGRRHHTMLHIDKDGSTDFIHKQVVDKNENVAAASTSTAEPRIVANFSKRESRTYNVLLATTLIKAHSSNGNRLLLRALLDQGSQASFVTEASAQLLGLKRTPINGMVSGLGDGQMCIKHWVFLCLESRHNPEISINITAYVLSSLTSILPCDQLDSPDWLELEELQLADPKFCTPGKIDLLLGAEVYSEILLDGMMKQPKGNLIAQNTAFGWVLSGKISNISSTNNKVMSLHLHIKDNDDTLKRFWELEAEPDRIQKLLSKEEQICENLYETTTMRNKDGRFIVKLPFNNEDPECQYGQSKDIAMKKLWALERRLKLNPKLYEDYRKVIDEYLVLGHMAPVDADDIDNPKAVYLPHHAVVREDRETTKVRVVFNASSKGTNDVSLNDNLLVGPKIQQDLRHILMRWRAHQICIVADLVKMYRQVLVRSEDTNFQRILWRPNTNMPIQHYKLLTLTFGTACAPYLAVKTLQKLAEVEKDNYPVASEITRKDFYVDDLLTGCDTLQEAKVIYKEMNAIMKSGGFEIQKWNSNSKELLQYIGSDMHDSETLPIKMDNMLKVLGVQWNRDTDNFEYIVNLAELKFPITKRQVLSNIARLYDPMGWIAPVVIGTKIIIQKIWKAHLDWDDPLTDELQDTWLKFRQELIDAQKIKIPRWFHSYSGNQIELHAFSDASQTAYAAAVYVRVLRVGGRIDLANESYEVRHPIILPAKSHLSMLLVSDAHRKTLHGGPQIMMNYLRSKYWILRAREQVKKCYRRCIICLRHSKASRVQLMGQLPEARLKPCKPFKATGVDYAGPVSIKFSPGRGAKCFKGYICLFVCMVTRAIHIEAVTDLTAKGFIAAFRRFTSRRGHCQDLYSDNGTNFVGADKQLREMFNRAKSSIPDEIAELLSLEHTTWHFIPPQSPNFGGLWEAGIRCAKNHLKRVIGDSMLTYEELTTVLSQIEACLNSRPISVLSSEADDPLPLTPGHFLVGEPILNVSDENYVNCNINGQERWHLIQKMVSDFWRRWSKEYLLNLNQRYKWNTKLQEPNINDICVIRDDNIPPSQWLIGRIIQKHVGPDNVTRVVTLKCKNGCIKRPLSKISILGK